MSNLPNATTSGLPPHSLRYNPPPQADAGLGAGVESVTASSRNRTEPTQLFNGTGYYVENDEADNNFTDVQTLFLACFATLVPLVLTMLTAFVVRVLWRKYRRNRDCRSYDGVLHQEESLDHLSGHSGAPLHAHLLNSDKVKPCDSQFSITADEIECSGSPVLYSGSSSRTNHASANGSIITMTLKNNHLIVETEERNDGVFVVEVQQGVRREGAAGTTAASTGSYAPGTSEDVSDQRALVHNPPQRFNDDDKLEEVDEEYYPETTSPKSSPRALKSSSTNTGLSQSTLSVSSNDPNPGYQYGNQTGYDLGYHGYPIYNGYINDDPLPTRLPDNKPKITSAVYKQNGRLLSMASMDGGGLSSDRFAKVNNQVETDDKDDAIQEEQRRLGNAPKEEEEGVIEKVKENILTTGEPKFEKLTNDLSPLAEGVVNGKQYENKAFETNEKK